MIKLYDFKSSPNCQRVKVVLAEKNLPYEIVPVDLTKKEQKSPDYLKLNPYGKVPVLTDDSTVLYESLVINEYLEEKYPNPPLLPKDAADKALARGMALVIACEVHPIQNLRVLNYVKATYHQTDEQVNQWAQHWIDLGLSALQEMILAQPRRGKFCVGDTPTLADICLIPQLGNARRYGCDLSKHPTILEIEKNCAALPAFANAAPEKQPDAE